MVLELTQKKGVGSNETPEHAGAPPAAVEPAIRGGSTKKNSETPSRDQGHKQEDLIKRFELLEKISRSLDPQRIESFLEVQKVRLGETLQGIEQTAKDIALEKRKLDAGHPLVFDKDISKEDLQRVPDAATRALRTREAVGEARRGLQSGVLSSHQNEVQYTGIEPLEALFGLRIGAALNQMGLPAEWIGGQAENSTELMKKVLSGEISIQDVGRSESVLILNKLSSALKILNEDARAQGLPEMRIHELEALEGKIQEADQLFREEGKRVHDLFRVSNGLPQGTDISGMRGEYAAFNEMPAVSSVEEKGARTLSLPHPAYILQYQQAADQNVAPGMVLTPQSEHTLNESIRVLDYMHLGLSPGSLKVSSELLGELGIPEQEFKTLQGEYSTTTGASKESRIGTILRNDPLHGVVERLQGALAMDKEERAGALLGLIEDVRKGMTDAGIRGEMAKREDGSLFNRSMEIAGVLLNPLDGTSHMYAAKQGEVHTIASREKKWMGRLEYSETEVTKLLTEAKEAIRSDRHTDGIRVLSEAIAHAVSSDELSRVYGYAASDRSVSSGFTAAMFLQMGASLGFRIAGSSAMRQLAGARTGGAPAPGSTGGARTRLSGNQFNELFQVKPGNIRPYTGSPSGGGASGGMPVRGPVTRGTSGGGGWEFGSSEGVGGGGTATLSRPVNRPVIRPVMSAEGNQALESIRSIVQRSAVNPGLASETVRAGIEGASLLTSGSQTSLALAGGLSPLAMPSVEEVTVHAKLQLPHPCLNLKTFSSMAPARL